MKFSIWIAAAVLLLTTSMSMSARDRSSARSMVVTKYGIVATSHVQASVAGSQILARGGSAVDAAIAANAVLGVTEPMMNGMGGDLFAIYWEAKTGKLYGLNASGWAPSGLTIEYLKAKGATSMPPAGIDSVTVPGAVAGWHALHERFGRLAWKDLFQPAIFYADDGYPVPEIIASYWTDSADWIANDAEARRVYLPVPILPRSDKSSRITISRRRHDWWPEWSKRILQRGDCARDCEHVAESGRNDGT